MSCAASKVVSDCGQLKPEFYILPLKNVERPRSCQLWEPLFDRRQSGSVYVNPVYWAPWSSLVITSANYVIGCALCCLDQDQFDTSMGSSSYAWNFVSSSAHNLPSPLTDVTQRCVWNTYCIDRWKQCHRTSLLWLAEESDIHTTHEVGEFIVQ